MRGGLAFVDKKASIKLDEVCKKMLSVTNEPQESLRQVDLLEREIAMHDEYGEFIIQLKYIKRNKLFAALYNLRIEQFVEGTCERAAHVDVDIKKRATKVTSGELNAPLLKRLEMLVTSDLFIERLSYLDVVGVSFEGVEGCGWRIVLEPYVGSCTWNLIPPVMYLIEPSLHDCARCIEALRMAASCF